LPAFAGRLLLTPQVVVSRAFDFSAETQALARLMLGPI
jgi:hypothetical protein